MNTMIHGIDGWGSKRALPAVDTSGITRGWARGVLKQQREMIAGLKALKVADSSEGQGEGPGEEADPVAAPATLPLPPAPRREANSAVARGRDHRKEALDRLIATEVAKQEKSAKPHADLHVVVPETLPSKPRPRRKKRSNRPRYKAPEGSTVPGSGVHQVSSIGWQAKVKSKGVVVFRQTFPSWAEAAEAVRAKRIELGLGEPGIAGIVAGDEDAS